MSFRILVNVVFLQATIRNGNSMDIISLLILLAVWIFMVKVILPKLGIPT